MGTRSRRQTRIHSPAVDSSAAQTQRVLGGEGDLEGLLVGHDVSAERKVI